MYMYMHVCFEKIYTVFVLYGYAQHSKPFWVKVLHLVK